MQFLLPALPVRVACGLAIHRHSVRAVYAFAPGVLSAGHAVHKAQAKKTARGADKLTVKICEAEVFSGLLLLLWRYYAQKPIVFALSPPALGTSLRQPSPLPEGGYIGGMLIRFQVNR